MDHDQRQVTAPDGTPLHVEQWTPEDPPRFVVVIAHGGAEHIGRYAELAADLVAHGGLVFGLDHRGQGKSGGPRGHVERFEDYASDLRHVIEQMAASLPDEQAPENLPWFLFGHSMGGLIVLTYLLDHERAVPLRGAIVSSPLLGLTMKVNPIKLAVGKLAAALLPRLTLPSGIPPDAICRNQAVVDRYVEDERRVDVVSAGWFAAMNNAIDRVRAEVNRIRLPMLWYVGTGDRICDHHATEATFAALIDPEARDQTLQRFEGYYHELHNEPAEDRAPVIEMLVDWIESRL